MIDILVSEKSDGEYVSVGVWIDTAFDGHLVLPGELIERLNLEPLAETEAILADGSMVTLDAFVCYIDWFGNRFPLQVISNDGRFPLLGTGLLDQRVLHVDYVTRELRLD